MRWIINELLPNESHDFEASKHYDLIATIMISIIIDKYITTYTNYTNIYNMYKYKGYIQI